MPTGITACLRKRCKNFVSSFITIDGYAIQVVFRLPLLCSCTILVLPLTTLGKIYFKKSRTCALHGSRASCFSNYSSSHINASSLGIVLYVSCRERVVDIPLRTLGVVSFVVRWCQFKIVFQAKWQIRLSVKTSQRPCMSNRDGRQYSFTDI